mgnify:FL=1
MNYAERMKNLRQDNNLSQKKVADMLGVAQTTYSQYELEKRPMPIDYLIALCKFYNVSADYMLGVSSGRLLPECKRTRKYSICSCLSIISAQSSYLLVDQVQYKLLKHHLPFHLLNPQVLKLLCFDCRSIKQLFCNPLYSRTSQNIFCNIHHQFNLHIHN